MVSFAFEGLLCNGNETLQETHKQETLTHARTGVSEGGSHESRNQNKVAANFKLHDWSVLYHPRHGMYHECIWSVSRISGTSCVESSSLRYTRGTQY